MANKKKYTIKEFNTLKDIINENEDLLVGDLSKIKEEFKNISSIISSAFTGTEEDINNALRNSKSLRELLGNVKESCATLISTTEKVSENSKKIKENFLLDDKEYNDSIKKITEYKKITEELNELKLKYSGNTSDKIYDSKKKKLTEKQNSIKKHFSKDDRLNALFDASIKKDNDDLNEILVETKKIGETIEKNHQSYSKVNEVLAETSDILEEQSKTVEGIKKGFEFAFGFIGKGFEKWKEIDEKVFSVGRQIGLGAKELRGYQINVMNNYDEMASKLGMTFEELFKFQEQYSKNTGRAITLTNEQVESLGTMTKLVGDVATEEMVKNMDDFGASTQTATSYLALNYARARGYGLDAQKSSEAFSKNIKLASKYTFSEGVNGISKMTLLSQKLKFNMDSIANAAEKFETVEGAIGTAANLQMLGGSFSSQFGNPLEAMNMAMLDMESFTNKIIDTFSGKATFNRETGQVEMSAIDKRFLKEAAKQLGIAYDEVWNMASQQAKIDDIERSLNVSENFSEQDKAWISSKAQYDAENKTHYLSYIDENGDQQKIDVSNLTKKQIDIIKDQGEIEKYIQSDVHGIHSLLAESMGKELKETRSWNETQKGLEESTLINFADIHDEYMVPIVKGIANFFGDHNIWWAWLGGISLITIVGNGLKGALSDGMNLLFQYLGGWLSKGLGGIFGGLKSLLGKIKIPNIGSSSFANLGIGGSGGFTLSDAVNESYNDNTPRRKRKQKGKQKRKGGKSTVHNAKPRYGRSKIGRIANLGETLLQGASLLGDFDLFGQSEENEVQEPIETTSVNIENNDTFNELQKQTELLRVISNNYGISKNDLNVTNENYKLLSDEIENGDTNSNVIIDSALTVGSMVGKLNPYAQVAMGLYDMYNASETYDDQIKKIDESNLSVGEKDKLKRQASDKKNERYGEGIGGAVGASIGAALGTMIPIPVLGTAIGSIAGGYIGSAIGGFIGENVNAASDFLFGSDNMTEADKAQQRYEETKIGFVDIRDPQLQQKAYLATCQIHDIVVSMWHHMNVRQSNGLEEEKGLFGGLFSSSNVSKTTSSTSYNSNHNTVSSNEILSKPTVGEPTYIRENANYISPSYYNNLNQNSKLDLNVSGTIKLTTENGNSAEIDMNKLLNNTQFMNSLVEMIGKRFSSLSNQGGRVEKSSVGAIMHYGYGRESLNGN